MRDYSFRPENDEKSKNSDPSYRVEYTEYFTSRGLRGSTGGFAKKSRKGLISLAKRLVKQQNPQMTLSCPLMVSKNPHVDP